VGQRQFTVAGQPDFFGELTAEIEPAAEFAHQVTDGPAGGREASPTRSGLPRPLAHRDPGPSSPGEGTRRLGASRSSRPAFRRRRKPPTPPRFRTSSCRRRCPARAARSKLLEALRPLVARHCRAHLGPVNRTSLSADDVTQEVCLAVLTALPNYRVQGRPFLAFVYGIAAHKLVDAHRAVTRARSDPVAEVPDSVAPTAEPEQCALQQELAGKLRLLLDELPDKQREILVLRVVVGLSAEETAQIVGATAAAVRVTQHRALARLRKRRPRPADRSP
jgi:RNA polymerase sigma-70 factor, ECF subfamily